jgi:hypothetical protein
MYLLRRLLRMFAGGARYRRRPATTTRAAGPISLVSRLLGGRHRTRI